MVKVSFVVIGFNIENYIQRCIKSILVQTLEEIEIIFVDDGSTDRTLEKIREISNNDSRLKIIKQDNKGANEARKAGVMKVKGEYVVFVDGDDWIENTLAYELYEIAEKNTSDIICYDYYKAYEQKNIRIKENRYDNIENEMYLKLILEEKITHTLWNKFISKKFLHKTMFENVCGISMGEDLAANVVLGIAQPKVIMSDKAYYYYYQRNTSSMNKSSSRLLEIEITLKYIEQVLQETDLLKYYKEQVDFLWFIHCYFGKVICSKLEMDENHKKLYNMWKNKNIDLKNNHLTNEYIKKIHIYRRMVKYAFDLNYYIGVIILKIEHKIRKIKYS